MATLQQMLKKLWGVQLPIAGRGSGLLWWYIKRCFYWGNHGGKVRSIWWLLDLLVTYLLLWNQMVVNNFNRIKENIKRIKRLPKLKGVKEIMYPDKINLIDIKIILIKKYLYLRYKKWYWKPLN